MFNFSNRPANLTVVQDAAEKVFGLSREDVISPYRAETIEMLLGRVAFEYTSI